MDDRYPHSAWYDQGAAPQTGKAKKPRARRGLKITMLCICGALVLLAAVYGGIRSVNWTFRVVTPMQSDAPKTEDELPDDFRSFFEDYFQSQSASYSGSSLDRATPRRSSAWSFRAPWVSRSSACNSFTAAASPVWAASAPTRTGSSATHGAPGL